DVELNGVVSNGGSGASGLIKNGTGSLDLNASNTFTGGVTIKNGNVVLGNAGALNLTNPNAVSLSGGALRINGNSATVASITGAGGFVENAHLAAATLTVHLPGAEQSFGGTIRNGTGAGVLTVQKTGGKTWTLSGSSSYT